MNKKIGIGFLVVIILIVLGGMITKIYIKNTEYFLNAEKINDENTERMNEEYISIFLDNREDFEYVADMMNQWPDGNFIEFEEGISSDNQEIAHEIENNTEFYEHLKNLYNLKEISDVVKWENEIEFSFSNPPKEYHGGFFYWKTMEEEGILTANKIDEHWTLVMLPDV